MVDIEWEKHALSQVKILSKAGRDCKIRYGNQVIEMKTKEGGQYVLNEHLK